MKCPCWYRFSSSRSSISRSIGARATKMRVSRPCSCRCYDCCLTPVIILLLMQICETHLVWWKPNSSKHRGISANSCPDHCHSAIGLQGALCLLSLPHRPPTPSEMVYYSLVPPNFSHLYLLLTCASTTHWRLRLLTCASTTTHLRLHFLLTYASLHSHLRLL